MKNKSREFQRSLDFLRDDFKTSTSQGEILDGSHVRGESRLSSDHVSVFSPAIPQNNTISSPENLKVLWAFCIPSEFNTNPTLA